MAIAAKSYSVAGISTLNYELGAKEITSGSEETKPASLVYLGRINGIGSISLPTEQIDVSAIDDKVTRYEQGRQDSGGEWAITVNVTADTVDAWTEMKNTEYWFEAYNGDINKGYWVKAKVPDTLPLGEIGQNEASTMEISLTLTKIYAWDTGVAPTKAA
jgi:hypothetical protein